MNITRTLEDIEALEAELSPRQSGVLSYDLRGEPVVEIHEYRFPDGWLTTDGERNGTVRIYLPDSYPRFMPEVYLEAGLRFEGDRPHTLYPASRYGPDGWARYCIHDVDWDGGRHDLAKLFQILEISLEHPTSKNPLQER